MPDTGNIQLSQGGETPLNNLATPFGAIRYLYSRSADSVAQETQGQDYLAFRYDDERVTFALCDGVSQSFMGDVAARFLGDQLVDWLWKYDGPSEPVALAAAVQMYLNHLRSEAETLISQYPLPDDLPALTREALEGQRAYGSEAMFVAGRAELSSGQDRVLLCWLGDSTLKALDDKGQIINTGPHGTTAERWSSVHGVKGRVHAWKGSSSQVTRLVAHSDGIETETVMKSLGTHGLLQQAVDHLQTRPASDDISLLDVNMDKQPAFRPIEVPGQPKPPVVPQVPTIPIQPVEPPTPTIEGWREIAVEGLTGAAVGVLIVWRLILPND
jgi:hypothetical protein